jgi:outer membrane protein OmpA-like peptidoglycan-associated protein
MRTGAMLPRAVRGLLVLALSSCSSLPDRINPVTWWHDLNGGAIAEQRPPPPNADAPYPSIATVPPKPTPPDPAVRQKIADGLIADRTNAHYAAAEAPLPPPRPRAAVPQLSPPDPNNSSASLAATSAPARPATPPRPAPVTPVAETPLPAPSIPAAPPLPPQLAGVDIGPTAPAPPPAAPPPLPPTPAALSAEAAAPVPVAFPPGTAIIPPGGDAPLKALAARRGTASIEVIGYGEATDTQTDLQTAGVTLGLARAQAMAAALVADGVPMAAIRMESQASGRGGAARLIN